MITPHAMSDYFQQQKLPSPPVPTSLQGALTQQTPHVFGTVQLQHDLYDLGHYLKKANDPTEDYLLLGHGGHGIQSHAMHYYLVQGPLAVFLQIQCGSAYGDLDKDALRLTHYYGQLEALLNKTLTATNASNKLASGQRLIVFESDFAGNGLAKITDLNDPASWKKAVFPEADADSGHSDALSVALALLGAA
jgi:hypothetical protein